MKAAFLDRDGVINKDSGYLYKISDFEFVDGCIDGLRLLQSAGYAPIIVTNQSGIGRGYYTEEDYRILTRWYLGQLKRRGVNITAVFHCPHKPGDGCSCRKPAPGLFYQALKQFPAIRPQASLMVGDKVADLDAAAAAGVDDLFLVMPKPAENQLGGRDYADRVRIISSLSDIQWLVP